MSTHHDDPPPRITRRGLMLLGIQMGVIGALGWRMRDLQIVQSEHFHLLAEENRINIRLLPPARGLIRDRNGRLMAGNRQNYRVVMVREQARNPEAILARLGQIIDLPADKRERALKEMHGRSAFVPVVVAEHLTWQDVARVQAQRRFDVVQAHPASAFGDDAEFDHAGVRKADAPASARREAASDTADRADECEDL